MQNLIMPLTLSISIADTGDLTKFVCFRTSCITPQCVLHLHYWQLPQRAKPCYTKRVQNHGHTKFPQHHKYADVCE